MIRMSTLIGEWRYLLRDRTALWCMRGFLLTLILAMVALALWWPAQSRQHDLSRELRDLSRLHADMERAMTLARQVQTTRTALARLEEQLARGVEQAEWIESVARIASSRQLRVLSQSVEEDKPRDGYQPLMLTVSVAGGYRGLRELLLAVSELPMLCVIHELRIEAAKDQAAPLRAQLKLLAFRRHDADPKVARL